MSNHNAGHPTRIRRRMLVMSMALAASLAALTGVSSALAAEHHPTGKFAPFADCPLSNSSVDECIVAKTESGEVLLGKKAVPITKTITLQGGTIENEETEALTFVGAEDGNTLSKTPQPVPGGLAGLINCNEIQNQLVRIACKVVFENGLTGVNAITELAALASSIGISTNNLVNREGIALSLPVKIKLENPLLGSECYIGSNPDPIVLNLTTGTTNPPPPNKPISGKVGKLEFEEEGAILLDTGNSLVNNSFAAPGATGCDGIASGIIDPLINAKIGIPAAGGNNTAILNNTIEQAAAAAVRRSE